MRWYISPFWTGEGAAKGQAEGNGSGKTYLQLFIIVTPIINLRTSAWGIPRSIEDMDN